MSSSKELLTTLDGIADLPVFVIGDLILDQYIWGKVDRISPEAPVPVVHVRRTEDRLGGAGNAVRNLRSLGARVELCGILGDDDEGRRLINLFLESGIGHDSVFVDSAQPTSLKTRVIAHSQQVVRIDREDLDQWPLATSQLFLDTVRERALKAKVVVVSDYGKGTITESCLKLLADMRESGELTAPVVVDPHPANYDHYSNITVAKPNRHEAEKASGLDIRDKASAIKAAQVLLERWSADMMLITLGEDGLVIVPKGASEGVHLETMAQEVYDVSGAGDTVTALFSAALGVGASPEIAGHLANIGAGIVVSEVGTVSIDIDKLRDKISELST